MYFIADILLLHCIYALYTTLYAVHSRYTFPSPVYVAWHILTIALNEAFLGSLQFNLPTGRNDRGDETVMLQCLNFKTPNLKSTWNLSFSRLFSGLCKTVRLLMSIWVLHKLKWVIWHSDLELLVSIDNFSSLPNLSLFLHNFWLSLLGYISVKLRNAD